MDRQPTPEPRQAYRALLEDGAIQPDPSQAKAMDSLQSLHEALGAYAPQMGKKGWMARLSLGGNKMPPPRGLYMWGGVGRGKSMLMDLFFETVAVEDRQRVHFHAFMQEVHKRLHSFREAVKAGQAAATADPPGGARARHHRQGVAALLRRISRYRHRRRHDPGPFV